MEYIHLNTYLKSFKFEVHIAVNFSGKEEEGNGNYRNAIELRKNHL